MNIKDLQKYPVPNGEKWEKIFNSLNEYWNRVEATTKNRSNRIQYLIESNGISATRYYYRYYCTGCGWMRQYNYIIIDDDILELAFGITRKTVSKRDWLLLKRMDVQPNIMSIFQPPRCPDCGKQKLGKRIEGSRLNQKIDLVELTFKNICDHIESINSELLNGDQED